MPTIRPMRFSGVAPNASARVAIGRAPACTPGVQRPESCNDALPIRKALSRLPERELNDIGAALAI
ncbi:MULTISPECIES: hypothetical protein [unclassified Haematobacter]|uniref:hypothetical protein n=1 Tax=unclassified Haematobacter TaxID=2640585 RepID=UPI0025BD5EE2|nr:MULTISPECIES: hypothetical protein [unclassified Haematobacter]